MKITLTITGLSKECSRGESRCGVMVDKAEVWDADRWFES